MYRAANTYLQGKTDSGISKVYFVIWKDDTATLKVAACYACSRNNQTIKETHIYFIFNVIILILLADCFFKDMFKALKDEERSGVQNGTFSRQPIRASKHFPRNVDIVYEQGN